MKKKLINFLLFSLITISCSAQTGGFKFYGKLDTVKFSGFYNIELTPQLNARLKTDYSDLRIVNDSGKWVPHLLHFPETEQNNIFHFDIKFTRSENSKANTTLIIENKENKISNIGLLINNTLGERFSTLSGSNDSKSWFVINDSILINPSPAETGTANTFLINFPSSSYRFFKIVIQNNNKDPFDIIGVVNQASAINPASYKDKLIQNPNPDILQKDSGKISYIKVTQQQPYQFDKIGLHISGVKYYNRKVDLYVPDADNSSFANPGQLLQSFTVSNNSTLKFNIPLTKASVFYLLINNEDNLPLTVNGVTTAISNYYITTYLEAGSNYRVIMDNEAAIMPNYDLSKLNSKIPDSISFLQFEKITAFAEIKPVVIAAKNNNWLLWIAIAAALLILLFFTYKMLKEVDKRKTT